MPSIDDRLLALGLVVSVVDFGEDEAEGIVVGAAAGFEDEGVYDAVREDASV